jgi:hypothetical protein
VSTHAAAALAVPPTVLQAASGAEVTVRPIVRISSDVAAILDRVAQREECKRCSKAAKRYLKAP